MTPRIIVLGVLLALGQVYGQISPTIEQSTLPAPNAKPDSQPPTNQASTDKNTAKGLFTVNASGNSFVIYEGTDKAQENSQPDVINRRIANATVAQAVCAGFMLLVAFLQIGLLVRQTKILDKQTEISGEQLEVSQIQMRASIHIEIQDFRKQKDFNGNDINRVEVWFKNTGPTPARKVRAWARFRRAPFPIPEDFIFPDEPTANHASVLTMGSDEIRKMDAYPPKEQAGYSGEVRCYVYGKITYWDVFGKGERHTNFCRFIEVDAKTGEFHVFSSNRESDNEAT